MILSLTPISGLGVKGANNTVDCPSSRFRLHRPNAVAERTRFFDSWLRRIAPDTHQDQAIGVHRLPVALVALPPQKNYKGFPVEHKLNRSSTCIHVAIPFGVREQVKDC